MAQEGRAALRSVLRVMRQNLSKGGEGDRSPMWTQFVVERFRADAAGRDLDAETLAARVKLLGDYTGLVQHVHAHRVRRATATCGGLASARDDAGRMESEAPTSRSCAPQLHHAADWQTLGANPGVFSSRGAAAAAQDHI
jgi:hypothetical protein